MKLNSRNVFPKDESLVFAVNNITTTSFWPTKHSSGFVGLLLFEDNRWYSMPEKIEVHKENDFWWIDLNSQPERSKREDSHTSECIPVILHDCCRADCMIDGKCSVKKKSEMRCSEHCGNTMRDK